ncbi:MAG TPA: PIN domain-containing protein [Candidatus Saccharimonadales bacterium]|jgi:predicted nucleic acid-binding protein
MNLSLTSTQASSVFLDANIVLEIVLERQNQQLAKDLLSKYSDNLNISSLTAHLITYFGQKRVDLPVLRRFLEDYIVLSLDSVDFEWAFNNIRNNDFEDALQLSVAIRNGCNSFITFDKPLVDTYANLKNISVQLLS